MKIQGIAILLSNHDTPRLVRKKLYDEIMRLCKLTLNKEELGEYEAQFQLPQAQPWPPLPSLFTQSMPDTPVTVTSYADMSGLEMAARLAQDTVFRYISRRDYDLFFDIVTAARLNVLKDDANTNP